MENNVTRHFIRLYLPMPC
jgi:hypothetical protein